MFDPVLRLTFPGGVQSVTVDKADPAIRVVIRAPVMNNGQRALPTQTTYHVRLKPPVGFGIMQRLANIVGCELYFTTPLFLRVWSSAGATSTAPAPPASATRTQIAVINVRSYDIDNLWVKFRVETI